MARLPIFPLGLVVVPGEPVPLHIFEERYKQLVADCAPLPGQKFYQPFGLTYAKDNKLNDMGCSLVVDEILHKYPDGQLDVMTYGQRRYRLLSTHEGLAPYLIGEVEWVEEVPEEPRADLRDGVLALYERFLALVEVNDLTLDFRSPQLSFEIAYRVNLEKLPKLELLETLGENARLEMLLTYLETAVPQIEEAREFRRRVRANGYFA